MKCTISHNGIRKAQNVKKIIGKKFFNNKVGSKEAKAFVGQVQYCVAYMEIITARRLGHGTKSQHSL